MTLRISYRTLLSKVRSSVPSLRSFRDAVLPPDEDDEVPVKKGKIDSQYKKKAEELEKKLSDIQKAKKQVQKSEETPRSSAPSGKQILANAFSGLTKKIPLETPQGKVIESKHSTQSVDFGSWDFPSINLLNTIEHKNLVSPQEVEEKALIIQRTFLQFGIDVEMEGECVGPTVIQYRLRPSEGVHLTKLKNLKDNLTLALKAKSIRIQAPIPGLGLVGIEVPNEKRDTVGIREVLQDKNFTGYKSKLALALGKDINGDFIV